MEGSDCTAWGGDVEGEKGRCASVSTRAGEAVVKRSPSFMYSFPALGSLLASLH